VTKATRDVPQIMIWFAAALLQVAHVETGAMVIDEFCSRFVYFYSGYVLVPYVFDFAARVAENRREATLLLVAWAVFEGVMVYEGISALPVVRLFLGFLGAAAVVTVSTLLSTSGWAQALAPCRPELDRGLSRFLPADGGDADRTAQIRSRT